jgi:hypothetical protein
MNAGRRAGLALVAILALPACQTRAPTAQVALAPPPPPIVVTPPPVVVPADPRTARACVPRSLGAAPRYPDTDAALREAPGAADRYQLMAAGRLMRQRRLEELERVVAGCR